MPDWCVCGNPRLTELKRYQDDAYDDDDDDEQKGPSTLIRTLEPELLVFSWLIFERSADIQTILQRVCLPYALFILIPPNPADIESFVSVAHFMVLATLQFINYIRRLFQSVRLDPIRAPWTPLTWSSKPRLCLSTSAYWSQRTLNPRSLVTQAYGATKRKVIPW